VIPIVDVSRHQGDIDFLVMRARGVRGLILRATHGRTADDRATSYYRLALEAGFEPHEVGWYSFINPKRGTGRECAETTTGLMLGFVGGRIPAFYMLDIEPYVNEPPRVGQNAWPAAQHRAAFSAWLREHVATMRALLPDTPILAYSNASFYDGMVGDFDLAASLEWIVPRYPVSTPAGYQRWPLPNVHGWEEWAFARAPDGPKSPMGVPWAGWQFSAGNNGQGARYGASSSNLDLNIVRPDAWARWTGQAPAPDPISPSIPQEDDDMPTTFIVTAPGKGDATVTLGGGVTMVGLASPADRTAVAQALGISPNPTVISPEQFEAYRVQALWNQPASAPEPSTITAELIEQKPVAYTLTATLTPAESA
jgi:hypothetical protein